MKPCLGRCRVSKSFSYAEKSEILRVVFRNSNIKSSSDFIITIREFGKKCDIGLMMMTEAVYRLEKYNWHESSIDNVNYVYHLVDELSSHSEVNVRREYKMILDYLLNDETTRTIFPLVGKLENCTASDIGWKIYSELQDKLSYCRKYND